MRKVNHFFIMLCLALICGTGINAQVSIYLEILEDCEPALVNLFNNTDISITGTPIWEWDINGELVYEFELVGRDWEPGYYDVTLTVYDDLGYQGEDYVGFQVYANPGNIMVTDDGEACPGEVMTFWIDENAQAYWIKWDFGDVGVPEDDIYSEWVNHTYYDTGTYEVTLELDHYCGYDTLTTTVIIGGAAKPTIDAWLANGEEFCPGDPVIFDFEGEYESHIWNFGDGNTSTERKPSHMYATDGPATYEATLTVTNTCGNNATDTLEVTFLTDLPAEADIYKWFDAQSLLPCPATPIEFETYASGLYEWDFGDGSFSNEQTAVNYYMEPGLYYITLRVWNGCGSMAMSTDSIQVMLNPSDIPHADFDFDIEDWGWDMYQGDTLFTCPGTLIGFRNESDTYGEAEMSYEWDFGDGTKAHSKNVSHTYDTPSSEPYIVTLTATNSCGGSDSANSKVMVVADIEPDATPGVVPEVICSGETVYFHLEEGVHPGQYTFDIDFDDGQVLQNATGYADPVLQTIANHTYSGAAGATFDYTFDISNSCGNTLSHNGTITITDDPAHKPFYYVNNSTSSGQGAVMADWSFPRDVSDHEFSIHFYWPGWPGGQDIFRAYFWYEGFYPDDDWRIPDGFVDIQTSKALSGDSLKAFIPIDPLQPPIIGFAVFWSCDGNYPPDVQPEAWGMQWSGETQVFEFPLVPGGYTNMSTVGSHVNLDDNGWDGICNTARPGQKYYLQLNAGQYLQLTLEEDGYYSLFASRDMEGADYITEMDYGDYYLTGTDTIMFYGMGECMESSSLYRYVLNGRQMDFIPDYDYCEPRLEYLTAGTLTEHTDTGAVVSRFGCPNDNVQFKIAGGIAWEWHFGDGSPLSNEQHPLHAYEAPGDYDAYVIATNACERTDTVHTFVKIVDFNRPPAYFWWDGWDYPRLEPVEFHYEFEGMDEAGNYTYLWKFGDGSTSNVQNPRHAYEFNGDYTIKLTVTNGCGSSTSEQMIYIKDAILECEAKIHIDSVDDTRTVYLRDISRGEVTNWFWDFGDGFTSSEKDPEHTYDYDGIFHICLSVFDSLNDCAHQVCRQVEIGTQLCTADFTAKANHATLRVQFTNNSDATESFWDFGNGHFSDLKDPVYDYTEPGRYPVCLSVYDEASDCYAYHCKEIMVGEENQKLCYANFNYFVDETNNSVVFTDLSSENITGWYWTFGDGSYAEVRDTVKYYRSPGIYEVCLFVFDENTGCADEICMEIPVGVGDCNLRAGFAYFIDINNYAVTFDNRTGGKATDWFWDFGDGMTSSARSPQHKYEEAGYYLAILSVWDEENGCSDHIAEFIQIGDLECRAGFEYSVDAESRNVQFYNQSLGTDPAFFWEFDDGTYSDDPDPMHQFPGPGIYMVALTVISDNETCMDFIIEPVQVGTVDCAARFRYFIDSANNAAYFAPDKIGDATAYLWFFGDGAMAEGEEIVHKFTEPGYYTVGLNTFNEATGCMDYWEETILIGSAGEDCRARFSYVSNPDAMVVNFGNRSKGKIVEYIWDFGDGTTSVEQNPEHGYPESGYYLVCLTVVNEFGIPNTFCDFVQMAIGDDKPCFAEFFFTVDSTKKTVEFVQQSHGNPDIFKWNFGDGSEPSNKENPAHVYETSDYYLVELIVESSTAGCINNRFKLVNVAEGNQGLRAAYSYDIDSSDLKATTYPVDFVGVSLGDAGKLKWDFGDGTPYDTTTLNPTHQYDDPGTYYACLTVSNPITGDENQYCEWITAGSTGIDDYSGAAGMLRNFPNPFDQTTRILYELAYGTRVNLAVFDQAGRMVDILVHEDQPAGSYHLEYDGSNLDSGIYTLRLSTEHGVYIARMVVR